MQQGEGSGQEDSESHALHLLLPRGGVQEDRAADRAHSSGRRASREAHASPRQEGLKPLGSDRGEEDRRVCALACVCVRACVVYSSCSMV